MSPIARIVRTVLVCSIALVLGLAGASADLNTISDDHSSVGIQNTAANFVQYQNLSTTGAYFFEAFTIDGRSYIACPQYVQYIDHAPSLVFVWDVKSASFQLYQELYGE